MMLCYIPTKITLHQTATQKGRISLFPVSFICIFFETSNHHRHGNNPCCLNIHHTVARTIRFINPQYQRELIKIRDKVGLPALFPRRERDEE